MSLSVLLANRLGAIAELSSVQPDMRRPSAAMPAGVWSIQSDTPIDSLNAATAWSRGEVQVIIYAATLAECIDAAAEIRAEMHHNTWTVGTSTCHRCIITGSTTGVYDDPDAGLDDTRTLTLTMTIIHSET